MNDDTITVDEIEAAGINLAELPDALEELEQLGLVRVTNIDGFIQVTLIDPVTGADLILPVEGKHNG